MNFLWPILLGNTESIFTPLLAIIIAQIKKLPLCVALYIKFVLFRRSKSSVLQ